MSDKVRNPKDRFSHNEAHVCLLFTNPKFWAGSVGRIFLFTVLKQTLFSHVSIQLKKFFSSKSKKTKFFT